ncbi:MAG: sulfotransferase [Woeseiaceae bacterium]|nr:sulfotransferase [Woeseiaceae bacterium]
MNEIDRISASGRQAAAARNWPQVGACGMEIKRRDPNNPEGPFLLGLAQKAAGRLQAAADYFAAALGIDVARYDAAIELAWQLVLLNRFAEANELLDDYRARLDNSPVYLDLAGQAYTRLGRYDSAWGLYERALQLQPNVEPIEVNMATCAVYLGKTDRAQAIYSKLLKKHPDHQRFHYELAQLARAESDRHVKQMLAVLHRASPDPTRNIFLYYALGKELEDLGRWDESFDYYKRGGDAARSTMDYDVATDVAAIDRIVEVCSADWLVDAPGQARTDSTPIFVVGLPRTGTTLTERIVSSHSQVESIGETQVLHMLLRRASAIESGGELTADVIAAAAKAPADLMAADYMDAVAYRLGAAPFFIDKLPENVLNLGFVAKAWPDAKIVHLRRHPMDACFAMYKQSYFRFAYNLDDLAEYYLAYDRLSRHWRNTLGDRVVELEYEQLVADQEAQTRQLLDRLGLEFEQACLDFDRNVAPVATASSVQVREKAHTRSVNKWKSYAQHLEPLRKRLEAGGVTL